VGKNIEGVRPFHSGARFTPMSLRLICTFGNQDFLQVPPLGTPAPSDNIPVGRNRSISEEMSSGSAGEPTGGILESHARNHKNRGEIMHKK